ncbi:MAG: glycerophosphodiester phosphodiesterase [Desulfovibrionaceae bacterium]|jgi:glycerophosphoryl diester phosphodiesterase|nr:glycerophosphodiester phosphodiesterase [Desulfovibrionaceae bacterium]
MEWLTARPFAHRGLHGPGAPENSLRAILAAADRGFGVELDVRLLADGAVAVFHDRTLARLTGRKGLVERLTVPAMSPLRLLDTDQPIPLLTDVLDGVAGRVPLYIELKQEARPGPLESAVSRILRAYRGPFGVASFSARCLGWFVEREPGFARGQIAGGRCERDPLGLKRLALGNLWLNRISRPHFVSYHLGSLPHPAATRARAAGLPLLCWTARSPEDMARGLRLADNVVFEGFVPEAAG